MDFYNEKLGLNVPEHIAIILDGNGRWAKKRLLPRNAGHLQGSRVLERICDDAIEIGLKYLTVYVFSTENWKRSESEVQGLMKILRNYLKTCIKRAREKNMKVVILGKQDMLDEDIIRSINELEESSKNNTGLVFQIALSDVPFPVCSSLWHGISPFRNEQYRNQEDKATEKRNRYQKVIICPRRRAALSLSIAAQFLPRVRVRR